MSKLNNASIPLKGPVRKEIELLDNMLVFDPKVLRKALDSKHERLKDTVDNYISENPLWKYYPKVPKSYMVAVKYNLSTEFDKSNYTVVEDVPLLIYMFLSTVGDIYIPDRELTNNSYEKYNFILCFNEGDFSDEYRRKKYHKKTL